MPNGGITPDCVHCKQYRGQPYNDERPYCLHHQIKLVSPIRAFCCDYGDREPTDSDWLDDELDRTQLLKDMMYVWLGDYGVKFLHVPLAPIAEYERWTTEQFHEALRDLADKYLD